MRKAGLLTFALFLFLGLQAQVFNTGSTLKKKSFSIGLEPAVFVGGPSDGFNMYFHGGAGITSGVDLGLKFGVGGTNYFGADLEWKLAKNISLTTGAHNFGDFGLDGTLNFTFPLTKGVDLYTGADLDIIFGNEITIPLWIPLGVEIDLSGNMSFILESEIALTDPAFHVIGGGVAFYF